MLPQPYSDAYVHLQQALLAVEISLRRDDPDPGALTTGIATVQSQFQAQVLSLNLDALDPAQRQQIQVINPEIHKYLRLLSNDLVFLKAARQTSTRQQRCALMRDRVQTLIRLCAYPNTRPNGRGTPGDMPPEAP
ncbi:heterocyst frequency control protein PatD [Trichothermofontia sp.]